MEPSGSLQREHSPQGTISEFWLRSSQTSYQRCVERPLAIGMSAQPLALSGLLYLRRRGSTPLWGPGSIPDNWTDVCDFLKHPGSQLFWKVNKHGAFSIPRQALGLRANDQSCHHETWLLCTSSIGTTNGPDRHITKETSV